MSQEGGAGLEARGTLGLIKYNAWRSLKSRAALNENVKTHLTCMEGPLVLH